MSSKADKFAALKAARNGASRIKQYKTEDAEIYDEVSEEQYKEIVAGRLTKDDFIEDDDGSGYQDNGMDVWGNGGKRGGGRDSEEEEEESEEEDRKRARKSKPTTSKSSKKPSTTNNTTKPIIAPSAYRPTVSAAKEEDFMASLLSSVAAAPAPMSTSRSSSALNNSTGSTGSNSRKRKPSPGSGAGFGRSSDPGSEGGQEGPSSDGFLSNAVGKTHFGSSDTESYSYGNGNDSRPTSAGGFKKPRVSIKKEQVEDGEEDEEMLVGDYKKKGVSFAKQEDDSMDVDTPAEQEDEDEDDDFLMRKPDISSNKPTFGTSSASAKAKLLALVGGGHKGSSSAGQQTSGSSASSTTTKTGTGTATPIGTAATSRRNVVNASSVSAKALAAAEAQKKAEAMALEVQSMSATATAKPTMINGKAIADGTKSWMSIQESLNTTSGPSFGGGVGVNGSNNGAGNGGNGDDADDDLLFNASVRDKHSKLSKAQLEKEKAKFGVGLITKMDIFEPEDSGSDHKDKDKMDVDEGDNSEKFRLFAGGKARSAALRSEEDKERTLRMFWLDYLEGDNGVVHLVGKAFDRLVNKYVSVCVTVGGMQRNLFVLPRTKRFENGFETDVEISPMEIHQELDALRRKHGVEGRFAIKKVLRKYAFELQDVPKGENEWYKVVYPFDQPQLPMEASGATFSKIFGSNTSAFEMLVVKRKIMGPCWLEIKGCTRVVSKPSSWCKLEVKVSDPKNVSTFSDSDSTAPKDIPPLTVMSFAGRTIVNHAQNNQEILAMTTTVWENYNIDDPTPVEKLVHTPHTVVRPLGERFPPNFEIRARNERQIQTVATEKDLLNTILGTIHRADPDVIVGHEFLGSTLEVFLQRLKDLAAEHWSRIGRFRRQGLRIGKMWYNNTKFLGGRLVADLSSDGAKMMIDSVTWSMSEMCQNQLGFVREDIDPEDTAGYFDGYAVSPDRLIHFMRHLQMDAFSQMAIASKVQFLPLTRQLTNLAGNSWNRTLTGARAERNEYILLHEFHRLKYICPDKGEGKASSRQAKAVQYDDDGTIIPQGKRAKYQGGLVFEPKRGLWDTYVLVMDFNSLYPSIIQEYNIDFTTVDRHDDENAVEDAIPDAPSPDVQQGVLPRLIATLVGRRRQVKSLMKDKSAGPVKQLQWDIKQKALKLTANSMYGCLGFAGSRFYARPLASLTTFKGREILTATKELAEGLSLDVVYGDTDSVFVNSNVSDYAEAVKIGNEFKKHVNDRYKLLEIDIDAIFSRVLLLQKKKYAAVKVNENGSSSIEIKGLDMVRREYCKLSKSVSQYVLERIMSGKATEDVVTEIHDYLTNIGTETRAGKIDLDDLIVFKRLGKNPEDYPDKKGQPHVQVALRMKAKGGGAKAGDVIPYVFCLGEDGKSSRTAQADKAFHPDEFRRVGSELKLDFDYYLSQQVLPPIERLCDDIEGTDRARLAECLGLDPSRFQTAIAGGGPVEKEFFTFESQISDKERFRDADPLTLRCRACRSETVFLPLLEDVEKLKLIRNEGVTCTCGHILNPASISVQVENQIRAHIARYYKGTLVCTDCSDKTRMMSVYGRRCILKDRCRGEMKMEYPDQKLYNQLLYYNSLFDVDKAIESTKGTAKSEEITALALHNKANFSEIQALVNRYLDKCGRRYVDMGSLFGFMEKMKV